MPLSTLNSLFKFPNVETGKVAVCLRSMKRYWSRKKYQRLNRMVDSTTDHEDNENETTSMLEECRRRSGASTTKSKVLVPKLSPKITNLHIEPLKKLKDAYVEMMLRFASHVAQLNNGNVYLFKRIPRPPSSSTY